MKIITVDSSKNEATITLNSTELVAICNSLFRDTERKPNTNRLYADFMLIRDLSQYSHVDDWCLSRIVEQREDGLDIRVIKKTKEKEHE